MGQRNSHGFLCFSMYDYDFVAMKIFIWLNLKYIYIYNIENEIIILYMSYQNIINHRLFLSLSLKKCPNLWVNLNSNYTIISYIRHHIKIGVHTEIPPELDCCNSLLYGLSTELSRYLQSTTNTVARLFTRINKFDEKISSAQQDPPPPHPRTCIWVVPNYSHEDGFWNQIVAQIRSWICFLSVYS